MRFRTKIQDWFVLAIFLSFGLGLSELAQAGGDPPSMCEQFDSCIAVHGGQMHCDCCRLAYDCCLEQGIGADLCMFGFTGCIQYICGW